MIYEFAIASLLISNTLTLFLYFKQKKISKTRPESLELTEFMHDLLSGSALVQVKRVASADVILRSPRGSRG